MTVTASRIARLGAGICASVLALCALPAAQAGVSSGSDTKGIELIEGRFALGADMWWNPDAPGAGLSITQHPGGQAFVVWYGYDAAGLPSWKVMPGGTWEDPQTFTGKLYSTRGPAHSAAHFDPAAVSTTAVGSATLRFEGDSAGSFSWRLDDGAAGTERIRRQLFGPPNGWDLENFADLWWNPAESGWGFAIAHQFARLFATLFAYAADGSPTWFVMSDLAFDWFVLVGNRLRPRFKGTVYAMSGPPAGAAPAPPQARQVGTAKIVFDARDRATVEYTVDGRAFTKRLQRQPF